MIKHNSPEGVLSPYNPVASLKPYMRKLVNELFLLTIIQKFFSDKGGIENFCELDPDKLKTEIEFEKDKNYVKTYIYKEIIDEIKKQDKKVVFRPKYVITFDKELSDYDEEKNIRYGVIRLGSQPILYYIYIDYQELIQFIKSRPEEVVDVNNEVKIIKSEHEKRDSLIDLVIFNKSKELDLTKQPQERGGIKKEIERLKILKLQDLQGENGKFRINLSWNTTDDLDLHVITPNGEIAYNTPNRTIEHNGVFGTLDLDMNAGSEAVSNPQENVHFDNTPSGLHKIYVHFYKKREKEEVPFSVTIISGNEEGWIYNRVISGKGSSVFVASFEFLDSKLILNDL